MRRAEACGYLGGRAGMSHDADAYGPATGDRVRLGDTGLVIEVEHDSQRPGDEFLIGFGKTARDGMHLKAAAVRDTCDVVITNVVIIDPLYGIGKASIGIREGRIHAIGRAGNPDTVDGVDVVVGTGTAIVPGEGLIATAGAIDTHVHLLSPRIMEAALASGVTTIIGQEFGPVWGVGVNSPWALRHAFGAFDAWPVNIGFLARGSSSNPDPLIEALEEGGACGFKVHEDLGAHARALDTALRVAEDYDVQVALHTDGLNESLSVEDTLAVLDGRTIHAFHIEGCGGGHVPNVLSLAGVPNVIGSSTNPTLPFGRDAVAEHYDMIISAHGLTADLPSDQQLAHDRIRAATMGAEDVLHDLGVIPHHVLRRPGHGPGRRDRAPHVRRGREDEGRARRPRPTHDNDRVLRYMAKLTINPAIAHGLSHEIGSLTPGRLADIVLWQPKYFGAKPQLVLKSGFPAFGVTGDPNADHRHLRTAGPRPAVRRARRHPRRALGGLRHRRRRAGRIGPHAHPPPPRRRPGHPQHRPRRHDPQHPPRPGPRQRAPRPGHPRRRARRVPARRLRRPQPPVLPLTPRPPRPRSG